MESVCERASCVLRLALSWASPSILHVLKLSFSLNLGLAGSATLSASVSPALGLQTCIAMCDFYMGAGGH